MEMELFLNLRIGEVRILLELMIQRSHKQISFVVLDEPKLRNSCCLLFLIWNHVNYYQNCEGVAQFIQFNIEECKYSQYLQISEQKTISYHELDFVSTFDVFKLFD